MSLSWNLQKIKNCDQVCFKDGNFNPVTNSLISATLFLGLNKITEKNVDEWMVRLAFNEKLFGTILKKNNN